MLPQFEISSIIMNQGKVLIGRGKEYETPCGSVQPFETIKDAAMRVAFELTEVVIDPQHVIFVCEDVKEKLTQHRIVIYLYANYVSGYIKPSGVWNEARWVNVRELGLIQDSMSDLTVDAFYKFSVVLQQMAAHSGAQA